MKDLAPVGCTFTPKPVSLSSHAIQGFSSGLRASTFRLFRVVLSFATRLLDVLLMGLITRPTSPIRQHTDQPMNSTSLFLVS